MTANSSDPKVHTLRGENPGTLWDVERMVSQTQQLFRSHCVWLPTQNDPPEDQSGSGKDRRVEKMKRKETKE